MAVDGIANDQNRIREAFVPFFEIDVVDSKGMLRMGGFLGFEFLAHIFVYLLISSGFADFPIQSQLSQKYL